MGGQGLARAEVAGGDGLGALGEDEQRRGEPAGEHEGHRHRGEQGQQQGERQGEGVDALQAVAGEGQLLVVAVHGLDALGVHREGLGDVLGDLQQLGFAEAAGRDRHDHPQQQPVGGVAFGGAIAAALASLAELGGGGLLRHQRRQLGVGGGDDLAAGGEDGGRLDAVALAQLVEQGRAELRCGLELLGHAVGLDRKLVEEHLEGGAPELQAALEGGVDPHVEPRLDALHRELQRHRIHQHPRHHRHRGEDGHQA